MNEYLNNPDNLVRDTKLFLKSEYGKYIVSTLEEMQQGHLSTATDINAVSPDRHIAKYSAIKEVIELIKSPIG